MKQNDPAYIIRFYFKRLYKYAKQVQKGYNEEAIHFFRINVKKIRAFLRMMRLTAEKPDELKFPASFKKMYAHTGKIRDRQLFLKRSVNEGLIQKADQLKKEIITLQKDRKTFISRKKFEEIEKGMSENLPLELPARTLTEFFILKQNAIRDIMANEELKDADLHAIRKAIKDIIYINGIFRNDVKLKPLLGEQQNNLIKKYETLAHLLGLFNDTCMFLSFLKDPDRESRSKKEKEQLSSARKKWLAEKTRLKKEIVNAIRPVEGIP